MYTRSSILIRVVAWRHVFTHRDRGFAPNSSVNFYQFFRDRSADSAWKLVSEREFEWTNMVNGQIVYYIGMVNNVPICDRYSDLGRKLGIAKLRHNAKLAARDFNFLPRCLTELRRVIIIALEESRNAIVITFRVIGSFRTHCTCGKCRECRAKCTCSIDSQARVWASVLKRMKPLDGSAKKKAREKEKEIL